MEPLQCRGGEYPWRLVRYNLLIDCSVMDGYFLCRTLIVWCHVLMRSRHCLVFTMAMVVSFLEVKGQRMAPR